jgi:hypothetical protein
MAGLERRLVRLEERTALKRREPSEEQRKRWWLETARVRRIHENRNPAEFSADDLIRLLRLQGELDGMTTEDLRARLLAWRPPIEPQAIERVMARTICNQEPGTENMTCPPAWRESFARADELRERYAAVPDETLARWTVMQHELEEGDSREEVAETIAAEGERFGITEELMLRAIGPDVEEITDEERMRRLRENLAEVYYGEKGYRIQQHINRLVNERSSSG